MFESVQQKENSGGSSATVDIAPLIDMVFILLIFFLVTTTFVRETGIMVKKPEAFQTEILEPQSLRLSIAESGAVYSEGSRITLPQCRERVHQFMASDPDGAVIIIPDEEVSARQLVSVMDVVKQGGAVDIAVATRQKTER